MSTPHTHASKVIVVTYASIVPLVSVAGAAYFAIAFCVYKHQVMLVSTNTRSC